MRASTHDDARATPHPARTPRTPHGTILARLSTPSPRAPVPSRTRHRRRSREIRVDPSVRDRDLRALFFPRVESTRTHHERARLGGRRGRARGDLGRSARGGRGASAERGGEHDGGSHRSVDECGARRARARGRGRGVDPSRMGVHVESGLAKVRAGTVASIVGPSMGNDGVMWMWSMGSHGAHGAGNREAVGVLGGRGRDEETATRTRRDHRCVPYLRDAGSGATRRRRGGRARGG